MISATHVPHMCLFQVILVAHDIRGRIYYIHRHAGAAHAVLVLKVAACHSSTWMVNKEFSCCHMYVRCRPWLTAHVCTISHTGIPHRQVAKGTCPSLKLVGNSNGTLILLLVML